MFSSYLKQRRGVLHDESIEIRGDFEEEIPDVEITAEESGGLEAEGKDVDQRLDEAALAAHQMGVADGFFIEALMVEFD